MEGNASITGFFQRRKLLESPQPSPGELSKKAGEYRSQGLLDEAVTFCDKAGDREGLEALLEESLGKGDLFSFDAALRALGRESGKEQWEALGANALKRGLLWFAYRAYEKADNQAALEVVRRAMTDQGISLPA